MSSPTASVSGAYNNYYKASADAKSNPKNYAIASSAISQSLKAAGKPAEWQKPLEELVARESSFNPNAKNPKSTAAGLYQFLNGTRKNYGGNSVDWSDPNQQASKGLQYVIDRYGDPYKALQFWDKNKWY
ncbi:transglycosylase SLT domain-containing protein [Paenibacillus sp. FSL H7-0357]|uniref:aggregation-promoting factor C-terminal-like domain-containing protein n=1 Tax=Paenibacillus sp. FSL H7-0357 TaxID=1536774 RepID=UPI0009DDA897